MSRFNKRYVKRADFDSLAKDWIDEATTASESLRLLTQYRGSGHLGCWSWPIDTRCKVCQETDVLLRSVRKMDGAGE